MKYTKNFYEIKSNETIFSSIKEELKTIGYYTLPEQDIKEVLDYSKTVKQRDIAIIGIGGSTLGTFAIHEFLKANKESNKKLHFFESTDPRDIK